jgi:hypothetical protein
VVGVEIDQQPGIQPQCSEVGHQLRTVNGVKALHSLQLDNRDVFDNQVDAMPVNDFIAVTKLDYVFGLIPKALVSELYLHGLVINQLHKPAPKAVCTERAQPMTR